MTDVFTLTAPREALLAACETAMAPVERKNTIPVLANLLFDDAQLVRPRLRLSGTDLDTTSAVITDIPIENMPAQGITAPAALLHDILRKLPAKAEVTIKTNTHGQMGITCGRSRFMLQTLPGEDWPRLEDRTGTATSFEIPAGKFAAMLASVSFAISTEETRYYLNGVYLHCVGDQLIAVATDGHRLARAIYSAPDGAADMPGVIIHRKTVGLIAKRLEQADRQAMLQVTVSENMVRLDLGSVRITSKLIDGAFPDYPRVIPEGNPNHWRFGVDEMAAATDRVSTVSSVRGRAVKMGWGRDSVELMVVNSDAGVGQDVVNAQASDGNDVEIGFNAKYLGEMQRHMSGQADVALADGAAPARFAPVASDDDDIALTFVLMPMRV